MSPQRSFSDSTGTETERYRSNVTGRSIQRTTISSRDPAFEQALIDAQYHPPGYSNREPENMEELLERLHRPRSSLSTSGFSNHAFSEFRQKTFNATSEDDFMRDVIPIIRGNTGIPAGESLIFTDVAPLAFGIAAAKPGYYNGSRPGELDPEVRNDIGR